jgi:hypothetical protein
MKVRGGHMNVDMALIDEETLRAGMTTGLVHNVVHQSA